MSAGRATTLPLVAKLALVLSVGHLVGLYVCAALSDRVFGQLAAHPTHAATIGVVLPLVDLALAGLFGVAARACQRVAPGTPGKLRALLLGAFGALHFVIAAGTWAQLGLAFGALVGSSDVGLSFLEPMQRIRLASAGAASRLDASLLATLVSTAPMLLLTWAHWFLIPTPLRARFFRVFDTFAALGFAYAVVALPLTLTAESPELPLVIARHALTAVFAVRAFARLVPIALAGFQRLDVHALLASRHLAGTRGSALALVPFLAVLAVSCAACVLATVLSVMGGFRKDLERKILGNSAHVVVDVPRGTFAGHRETLARIESIPGVRGASPYVEAEVMVTSASNFAGAVLRGIDAPRAAAVTALGRSLTEDPRKTRGGLDLLEHPERIEGLSMRARCPGATRPLALDHADDADGVPKPAADRGDATDAAELVGILIGSELARSLRLCVGDDLEVVSPLGDLGPAGPMPKTRSFRVAGIFHSGMYEYDMRHVYVRLPVAQSFLRVGDTLSGIEVNGASVEAAPALAGAISRGLGRGDLRVEDFRKRNRGLFAALSLERLLVSFTLGITVLIAGCCVFATITLLVFEKRKEVGILKAMGATDAQIVRTFLSQGAIIGLLGACAGLGAAFLLCFVLEHFAVQFNSEVIYLDRFPVAMDVREFLAVAFASVATSVAATYVPARHASRMRPVDAVRND